MRGTTLLVMAATLALSGCFLFGDDDDTGDDTPTTCETVDDCTNGEVCAAGRCVGEGTIGLGGMCSANRDCSTNLYCQPDGTCGPSGSGDIGDPCSSGADCGKDLVCEMYGFGGTCAAAGAADLGDSCTANTDCIAGLICGPNDTCVRGADAYPPFTGVVCAPDAAPFKVFFEVPRPGMTLPDFFRSPFPNDARVNADGSLNLDDFPRPGPSAVLGIDIVDLYASTLAEDFDGFSSVANVTFRFSKEFDFDTIGTNGANVHFVDITDPLDGGFGNDRGRAFGYDTGAGLYQCQHTFQVAPNRHEPLLPGHKYAVFLTSAIRSAAGEQPVLDEDLAVVLGATQPTDATLSRVWTQYANFRTYLTMNTMTPADIAGVTVFTVQDTTAKMIALDAAVEALPVPTLSDLTLCNGSNISPCDGTACTSPAEYDVVHGHVSIPNYQAGTLPYEFPPDGGDIVYDGGGVPMQQGTLDVCVAITIPKTTMPGGGWPLVVHAHGTGGDFHAAIQDGIAEALATASVPMATLTYNGVGSGERKGASTRDSDGLVFNVVNPRAARDNHLQGAVDVIQTLRVAQIAPTAVDTVTLDFDPSKTYFYGHSQGSNVGIPATAVTDLAPAVIFSGAGSYLSDGILTKTSPIDASAALSFVIGEPLTHAHPVMTIWQTFFDRIDPVNYDPLIVARPPAGVASKHVHMTWGQGDTYSPEAVLNITAKAMRLQLASPQIITAVTGLTTVNRPVSGNRTGGDGPQRTAAMYEYAPSGYDGHFVSQQNATAVTDWTAFLTSAATAGTPTVP